MGPTNRNLLNHGGGKGDKDRTENVEAFKKNHDLINWFDDTPLPSGDKILDNANGRFLKRYGAAKGPEPVVGLSKIIIR
jgi:hypothetical protein